MLFERCSTPLEQIIDELDILPNRAVPMSGGYGLYQSCSRRQ